MQFTVLLNHQCAWLTLANVSRKKTGESVYYMSRYPVFNILVSHSFLSNGQVIYNQSVIHTEARILITIHIQSTSVLDTN